MKTLTKEFLDEIERCDGSEFDGEIHLTSAEGKSLIAGCRELLKLLDQAAPDTTSPDWAARNAIRLMQLMDIKGYSDYSPAPIAAALRAAYAAGEAAAGTELLKLREELGEAWRAPYGPSPSSLEQYGGKPVTVAKRVEGWIGGAGGLVRLLDTIEAETRDDAHNPRVCPCNVAMHGHELCCAPACPVHGNMNWYELTDRDDARRDG